MLEIYRRDFTPFETRGLMTWRGKPVGYSLELPWVRNTKYISCIPGGKYTCSKVQSKWGLTWYIPVEGRTGIIIHPGNTSDDLRGCIAIGEQLGSLKGRPAVLKSDKAFKNLINLTKHEHEITLSIYRGRENVVG